MSIKEYFATCPKGLELLLVDELQTLGASNVAIKLAGVVFHGDITIAYRACLWSRLANRILLHLHTFPAQTADELYSGIREINWSQHVPADGTLAVYCTSSHSVISHTLFAAQKVKDAIVDQLRDQTGTRPNIDKDQPNVRVVVHIQKDQVLTYIDLSGESLHKRGYRQFHGEAPLKENLAAAILLRANWPQISHAQAPLIDPMCGSGTLLIEAAFIAADIAPGLFKDYFGFKGWLQHNHDLWLTLRQDAETRRVKGIENLPKIIGFDQDPEAIKVAFNNIELAGLLGKVHVEKRHLSGLADLNLISSGLLIVNPPYGERLGEIEQLKLVYAELGTLLKAHFQGWHAAIFTANPELSKQVCIRATKQYAFFNGAIPCKLFIFDIIPEKFVDITANQNEWLIREANRYLQKHPATSGLQMFVNRLRKNLKHFTKRAQRLQQTTYCVYDADLPEYAFLIEIQINSVNLIEYQAPSSIDPQKVLQRRYELLSVIPTELDVQPKHIYYSLIKKKPSKE